MGDASQEPIRPASPTSARTLVLVALAFAATFLLIRSTTSRSHAIGRPNEAFDWKKVEADGKPVDTWKLTDLDGKPVDFASYKGRAIFLNAWATWCGPCLREMPSIARLAANPKLKDVAFLCVSDEDATTVMGYLSSHRQPMTMLVARGAAPPVFPTESLPATYVIAPDGRVARRQIGSMDWDTPEMVRLLEGLAREEK